MTSTPLAIALTGVRRAFGPVVALDGLDLAVPVGSVTVLLGPNGAGKTTTIRMITGAIAPDAGTVQVLGRDPTVDGLEVRARCGVVPPKPAFYERLTGRENLVFAAKIYDADPTGIDTVASRFGIEHALDLEVGGYSTGMRTRLALARASLHDPEVLLLDEPTAGLDPEASRSVLELIRDLVGRGRTVVMSTHLLHEAEGIADQVVVMHRGRARAAGPPEALAARHLGAPVVVIDTVDRRDLDILPDLPGVVAVTAGEGATVTVDAGDRIPEIVDALVRKGARVTRVEPRAVTLERLYFEIQRGER